MSKNNIVIEYPSCETVKIFPKNDAMPIKDLIIGVTNPNPNYKINRTNGNKNILLECILDGQGYAKFDNKWSKINKGDLLLYRCNDLQCYKADNKFPFKKIFLCFSCEYLDKMMCDYGIKSGIYKLNLIGEYTNLLTNFEKDPYFDSFYFYIAGFLNDTMIGIASLSYKKNNSLISRIKNELTLSVYKKISLDEIAKKFNFSETTLIRYFKKNTNETPYNYLLKEKIRVSKILLETTDKSIKEISYLLAFTDEHYFSFYFKKIEKTSPSQYKKRLNTL